MKPSLALAALIAGGIVASAAHAGETSLSLGSAVPAFALKDATGKVYSHESTAGIKALVVVFVSTECPINSAYVPRLNELHKQWASQGVALVAISSNLHDTPDKLASYIKSNHVELPVLKDPGNRVADSFGAQRTPEVFVFDAERKLRYRGRIDDQFGINFRRPHPTRKDLVLAVEELVAGKPVSVPTTSVAGCYIARAAKPKAEGSVTYAKQVSRIVQSHCQDCHRPGQIGPMPFMTYDDVAAWSLTIREVIDEGRMPPWFADSKRGHFANDKRLTPEDKQLLLAWLDDGMAKGDDKDLPAPRKFSSDWSIGKPDVVFDMPQEFEVPAEMPKRGVPYQRFMVKTNFTEDKWVQAAEARAGAAPVVHHIIVYIMGKGEKRDRLNPLPVLCGTAPGDMPLILGPGMAKKIPAGADLMFEMHYTPNGVAMKDRSQVGIVFAKEPPARIVKTLPAANPKFRIPAGDANYLVQREVTFPEQVTLLSFMPHMHLRGKDFRYEATYPDGRKEVLLWVPKYNFNWQSVYRLEQPIVLPAGTKVLCTAHFDNSDKNPNNPDPTKAVAWGEQTWEEMMIGWMDYAVDRPKATEQ